MRKKSDTNRRTPIFLGSRETTLRDALPRVDRDARHTTTTTTDRRATTTVMRAKRTPSPTARDGADVAPTGNKKPKKATTTTTTVERSDAARRDAPRDARAFTAIAWNVAGLRSFHEKSLDRLRGVIAGEAPDVVILQEHKLQETHCAAFTERLRRDFPMYKTVRFAVSVAKKGYSGVVVMCKAARNGTSGSTQGTLDAMFGGGAKDEEATYDGPKLLEIREGLGARGYTDEGRTMTLEFEGFYLVTAYVPNSGQDLKRLDYRIGEWERDMRAHLKELDAKKPVVYMGDLNVAHLDSDIWNVGASHIKKSAGTTPQEREAFGVMLEENDLRDAFRHFHGDAVGWFSYWSVRAGNRPFNKGLRLDYTLASKRVFDGGADGVEVVDAFILDKVLGSDHAPVGVTLALR